MRAKKRFGQHFLRDNGIIDKIIRALRLEPDHNVIEIGPGLGALTQPLLRELKHLHVVEIDKDIIPIVQTFAPAEQLTIHQQDALTLDLHPFAQSHQKIRLIGNLPYNISSPLLFHLLKEASLIEDMYFMLQKEVVDRICAKPGNKDFGRLSVMIQYACDVKWLFDVPPQCFSPPPRVMSAVLSMKPYAIKPFVAEDEAMLAEIVRQAFSGRRKTLRNNLKAYMTEEAWQTVEIDPSQRAETLSVSQFVQLANKITALKKKD